MRNQRTRRPRQLNGQRKRAKLSLATEEGLEEVPDFAESPLSGGRKEQDRDDRGKVGDQINAEEGHGLSPQNETHAASAATT